MAKQKIVWVISSTIIKYSLGELYQSGFQPISNLACDWSRSGDTQVFQAKNWEFDERFLRQVIQILLFIYESEIF